jgi:membrane fusion protein (multidrug efflux system)
VDLDDLWVDANFKETQLEHVRPGLRAEVRTDAFDSRVFPGRVDSIEAGTGAAFSLFPPENATGNWVKVVQRIPVKVLLDDPSAAGDGLGLRVGMSTEVTILLEGRPLLPWPLSILLR